jgi:dTDP-4-amino-4,6-dideoxygalactose transaminase
LGVVAGDAVLNVANAGGYTTIATKQIGAEPIFFDVQPETLHASLSDIQTALKEAVAKGLDPKVIVVTHLFGQINLEIQEIVNFAHENDLLVLEDCAQAAGAKLNGKHAGTFGDAATISFYPTKNLGASGDAGAIYSLSSSVIEKARSLRQYGWSNKYEISLDGGQNSRMDEIQAAILVEKLGYLDAWNSRRRSIFESYVKSASPELKFTTISTDESFVAHLVVVRHENKSATELAAYFESKGISTGVHYPIPDNRQTLNLKHRDATSTPVTDAESKRILTIPMFPEMTQLETDQVCGALANA